MNFVSLDDHRRLRATDGAYEKWRSTRDWMERSRTLRSAAGPRSAAMIKLKRKILGPLNLGRAPAGVRRLHNALTARARDIRLRQIDIRLPDLPPAFDGYRIVHISDLHFDSLPGIEDAVFDLLNGESADAMVLTGDFADAFDLAPEAVASPLARVLSALSPKDGAWATLGNHDSWRHVDVLHGLGVRCLINESVILKRGGSSLALTGVDDPGYFYTDHAARALHNTHDGCKIALAHSADLADHAADNGYALYLAGHTHGGQICRPNGKPIYVDLKRFKDFSSGLWQYDRMVGYTTAGAGVSVLPYRLFSFGEVALLTLSAETRNGEPRHASVRNR